MIEVSFFFKEEKFLRGEICAVGLGVLQTARTMRANAKIVTCRDNLCNKEQFRGQVQYIPGKNLLNFLLNLMV